MSQQQSHIGWRRHRPAVLFAIIILCGTALYTFRATRNPAGFFVDESSIAYNAYTISQTGQDEFGTSWPLFFRAFGDYKNPVFIYLLAALFKLLGPSILTSRLLSTLAGVLTAAILGLIATRISKRREVGWLVTVSTLLTPWLFEISRVSMEVSLYPAVLALFLLAAHRASSREKWDAITLAGLVSTLVLLTYTYSVGRLLAPMLALGLSFFFTRRRLVGLLQVWALYALALVPMIVFQRNHAEALTGRFKMLSYIKPETSVYQIASEFLKHYAGNLGPRRLLFSGDPNTYQVAHIANTPALLAATLILVLIGVCLIVRNHLRDSWWRFVLYGAAVSIVPASLTVDYFHMLRLVPLPVFLILLMVPALDRLVASRQRWHGFALVALIVLMLAQGAAFQWRYHVSANSPWRQHLFDANFPEVILAPALARPSRPIYLADPAPTAYIQSYWYAVLNKSSAADFVLLKIDESPPLGATVISTEAGCYRPRILAQAEPYTLYIVDREPRSRVPLPENAMRAQISTSTLPASVHAGEQIRISVHLKNVSDTVWPGCERNPQTLKVSLGGNWLDSAGQFDPNRGGRTSLPADLGPGQEVELIFTLDAPTTPGNHTLELDMVQEGVAWFGSKGSKTWRGVVKVE